MNNDFLYLVLCIVVVLVFVGIIYAWIKASSKMLNIKNNSGFQGIYSPAKINQRCSDGTGPNITPTIFIPGFTEPPPCSEGYRCIKLAENAPYGYCKAELGVGCKTIYDCAPLVTPFGPTGAIGDLVLCNGVCSVRANGNVLQGCDDNLFLCDASKDLICNNVTRPPTDICFNMYKKACTDDTECLGGICTKGTDDFGKVCYCPGPSNPVNTKICMFLDGAACKSDQECYGGICYHNPDGTSICQTRFLPGKPCSLDETQRDFCLPGYACNFSNTGLGGICQPLEGPTPNSQTGANTNEVNSLCTSYNVYTGYTPDGNPTGATGTLPILTCDPNQNLVCNYNLTTRTPSSTTPYEYLNGFGTCVVPTAKIGQPCSDTVGCAYPGVCIEDNNGVGFCSRPQYFDDNQSLDIYINNLNAKTNLDGYFGILTFAYPQILTNEYDTLLVQLVGGGGGGNYGWAGAGVTGTAGSTGTFDGEYFTVFYGGGGGGSGEILGYIGPTGSYPVNPSLPNGNKFEYVNTNESAIVPKSFEIDLNSFDWSSITLNVGVGGLAGSVGTIVPPTLPILATEGTSTTLVFKDSVNNIVKSIEAKGGKQGLFPTPGPISSIAIPVNYATNNGAGGTGFNGGGAGSGGKSSTVEAFGGSGNTTRGGVDGGNTKGGPFTYNKAGNGGNIGGGNGGSVYTVKTLGYSDGGGGGAGSCVIEKDNSGNILRTGGDGSASGPGPLGTVISLPALPGVDFTGGGGGGGSIYLDTRPNIQGTPYFQNGGKGGSGYALLKFMKIKRDINYVGQQQTYPRFPASGSSGECAEGFTSNGLYKITKNTYSGPEYCIPNIGYTCNKFNFRSPSGTLCMNSAGTSASGTCGSNYRLGIYIPNPPSATGSILGFTNSFFGKWHYANLPDGNQVNSTSRVSVYQVEDPAEPFYPKTRVIYQPRTAAVQSTVPPLNPFKLLNTQYFYYAEFSTKDISPNNPFNKNNITLFWKKVTIVPASTGRELFAVSDIKFTSGGNIAIIVNESATLFYPYTPTRTPSGSFFNTNYNRVYLCNISTDLVITGNTGTLTYPLGYLGPIFCYSVSNGNPGDFFTQSTGSISGMYFNSVLTLPFDNFVWDLDDKYNKSFVAAFKDKDLVTNKVHFFSAKYTGDFNTSNLNGDLGSIPYNENFNFNFATGEYNNLPKNIKYYVDTKNLFQPEKRYIWDTLEKNYRTNLVKFLLPINGVNLKLLKLNLEELSQEVGIQWYFNLTNTIANFKFYYQVTEDQYKFVNANFNPITDVVTSEETQLEGYVPDLVSSTTNQTAYRILGIGNLDTSMYTLVQVCE